MRTAAWTDSVSVLDRITAVFDAFGDHDEGMGVSALARRANLPKSTVSRIAGELVEEGLLDREGDTFYLGVRLFEFGQTVERPRRLRHLAYPIMTGLRDLTAQSVQLAVLDGADVVFLAIVRSEPAVRPYARIGGRLPAHATAVGKAILAFSPPEVVEPVVSGGLPAQTLHTITQPAAVLSELLHIRGAGVAAEREECVLGRSCMASPVLAAGGEAIAAISVSGATADVVVDHVATAVRAAAATLSHRAGIADRVG
ncbi:IclR family transcriptional regulator [Microbacterium sp. W1N]|uniref:IclR family transcriptional regulator n=1 Tax=Microbacterium festucae TaxID=2977531 RepID=UPI0021C194A2|nr:IclR family transcriptional regulator [Microbacterium festucae]MCT9819844.1 IclR family transcriptional regulator [Microbacterium festucae]